MMKNPTLEAVVDELKQAGISPEISHGSKHIQVRWANRTGDVRFATVSRRDSGEWHAPQNARRDVRHKLREDGMLAEPPTSKPLRPLNLNRFDQIEESMRQLNERIVRVENLLREYK